MSILEQIGNTPLVRLNNLGEGLNNEIYVKCEFMNPSGSIKDRIAVSIIDGFERSGALKPGGTLIEATAGNTGLALALVATLRGYKLVCVMPDKMSVDKRNALKALGVEVVITGNHPGDHPEYYKNIAKSLAEKNGWVLTDQFNNPDNALAHEHGTGAELVNQLKNIGAFVAGAGTGGTLTGVAKALKASGSNAKIVLADPTGSRLGNAVDGADLPDGDYAVEGIGGCEVPLNMHVELIDAVVRVSDDVTYKTAKALIEREGLLCGGSSGANVAAAIALSKQGTIEGPIVTIAADSWDRYRSQAWLKPA